MLIILIDTITHIYNSTFFVDQAFFIILQKIGTTGHHFLLERHKAIGGV